MFKSTLNTIAVGVGLNGLAIADVFALLFGLYIVDFNFFY